MNVSIKTRRLAMPLLAAACGLIVASHPHSAYAQAVFQSGASCQPAPGHTDAQFSLGPLGITNVTSVNRNVVCALWEARATNVVTIALHGPAGASAQCQLAWPVVSAGNSDPSYVVRTSGQIAFSALLRTQVITFFSEVSLPPVRTINCRLGPSVKLIRINQVRSTP